MQMRMARHILEAETSTLVIHPDDRSTDFLKPIYEGKGYHVLTGPVKRNELMALIKQHKRVYAMGHGCPPRLFLRGDVGLMGAEFGPLLAEKQDGLYIWCNPDAYAVKQKLTGFVTGMFISEVGEARMFGIEATQQQVDASNDNFSRIVRANLDKGGAHADVSKCYSSAECKITQFNSERMYVFNHGVPSPALHPTSYGIEREPEQLEPHNPRAKAEPSDYDPDWMEWGERLDTLAFNRGIDIGTLLEPEVQEYLTSAYLDGVTPEDALQALEKMLEQLQAIEDMSKENRRKSQGEFDI